MFPGGSVVVTFPPLVTVFLRVHHNHCTVSVCFGAKINDTVVLSPVPALIDEDRGAVFKCVSVNTVRPCVNSSTLISPLFMISTSLAALD